MMKSFSMASFVAGFMFGVLSIGAWVIGDTFSPSLPPPLSVSPLTTNASGTTPQSGAVSVTNQSAGPVVVVESVTVPPPGVWVAIRETNGTDLGNVLGAVRVNGPRSAISVPLLRATVPGSSYAVELYRDGGNDVFDLATDSVYVDFATGAPVIAYFATTQ